MKKEEFRKIIEDNKGAFPMFYQTVVIKSTENGGQGLIFVHSKKYNSSLILNSEYNKPISKIIPYQELD